MVDFQGQKLVEQLCMIVILGSAVVSFLVGYFSENFQLMMTIFGTGVALTSAAVVPNWFFLNKHPLKWLPSSQAVKIPSKKKK